MSGTVTALKAHGKGKRVKVYLDGSYAFSLTPLEAAKLQEGQFLSDEEIEAILERDAFQETYDRVLRFLAYRPRSEAEVRRYLKGKGVPSVLVEKVLGRLKQTGLVDDRAFAQYWVENREAFSPRSPFALRQELRRKGVEGEIIAEALEGLDDEDSAYRAGLPRARRWAGLAYGEFRRKLSAFLLRRGFSYETVNSVVERLWRELGEQDRDPSI